jgi:hypothetical protein
LFTESRPVTAYVVLPATLIENAKDNLGIHLRKPVSKAGYYVLVIFVRRPVEVVRTKRYVVVGSVIYSCNLDPVCILDHVSVSVVVL